MSEAKKVKLFIVLYLRKDSIMVSEQTMLFSPIKLKFFLGFSHLMNNGITNNLYVCDSVIVWFCDGLVVSFLCLDIFQSAPKLMQIFVNAIPRDIFLFFRI